MSVSLGFTFELNYILLDLSEHKKVDISKGTLLLYEQFIIFT